MALSNLRNEPRRELIEQALGLLFLVLYSGWVAFSVHLATVLYHPIVCLQAVENVCTKSGFNFWSDPGDLSLTIVFSMSVWMIYPILLFMHFLGEIVADWLKAAGIDPRPKDRYSRWR